VIAGLLIGRKIGWSLSKAFLYSGPLLLAILICAVWGAAIAASLDYLIRSLTPGIIAKVFAYGAGAYTSIPSFGLVADATVPPEAQGRHLLIEVLPFFVFVAVSVIAAFLK